MSSPTPEVTKRRVTCRSAVLGADGSRLDVERIDYVRPDFLDAFVAHARTPAAEGGWGWQWVAVSDEPDAGRDGYAGATYVPAELDHPLAGTFYPATDCTDCTHAPAGATVVVEG